MYVSNYYLNLLNRLKRMYDTTFGKQAEKAVKQAKQAIQKCTKLAKWAKLAEKVVTYAKKA